VPDAGRPLPIETAKLSGGVAARLHTTDRRWQPGDDMDGALSALGPQLASRTYRR